MGGPNCMNIQESLGVPKWARKLLGQKLYWRITLKVDKGKGGYIDEPEQIRHMLEFCGDRDEYDVAEVWMLPSRFKRLPEFTGF